LLNNGLNADYIGGFYDKNDVFQTIERHVFLQPFDITELFESEMSQLDIKYDDGKPHSGQYMIFTGDGPDSNCLMSGNPVEYDFAATGNYYECNPFILF